MALCYRQKNIHIAIICRYVIEENCVMTLNREMKISSKLKVEHKSPVLHLGFCHHALNIQNTSSESSRVLWREPRFISMAQNNSFKKKIICRAVEVHQVAQEVTAKRVPCSQCSLVQLLQNKYFSPISLTFPFNKFTNAYEKKTWDCIWFVCGAICCYMETTWKRWWVVSWWKILVEKQ